MSTTLHSEPAARAPERGGASARAASATAPASTASGATVASSTPVATSTAPAARNAGFTLIELLVVLVILGLLVGLVGPRLFGRVDTSKVQTAETQIKMLRGALQAYRLDVGRYPSSEEGLAALMRPPAEVSAWWNGPYLEDQVPADPWRTPYRYRHPVDNLHGFALWSLGADAKEGGDGVDADIGYLPEGKSQ